MTSLFKPMLACDADLDRLPWPMLASAKLDGVRAVVRDGVVYSRSNKPIPNAFVQEKYKHLDAADGELIVGEPTSKTCYRDTVSHVMSHDKTDYDLRFYVFDHIRFLEKRYTDRHNLLQFDAIRYPSVHVHQQHVVTCLKTLVELEEKMLDLGYEGLILRSPNAPYKRGRSTVKEGYLLKMKRFVDAEFEVIGFEERMHNGNEAKTNELGRTKRSSHAAGKTGRGDLGALIVRGKCPAAPGPGVVELVDVTFNVGTGFDDALREEIWNNQTRYLGKQAKVKYFPVGMKEAPRHPVFLGWRDRSDT